MEEKNSGQELDKILKWQYKILPWLIGTPTVLVAVFIYLASVQLNKFNKALETQPDSVLIGKIIPLPDSIPSNTLNSQEYLRWLTLVQMEQESFYRRYNQGGLLLMSRIYTKYLGFFTGMILAIVGAIFIVGKIREKTSDIKGEAKDLITFSIVSSSPGVIFGVLGTTLMLATILVHNEISIQDAPLYLNSQTIMSTDIINSMQNQKGVNKDVLDDIGKFFNPDTIP